MFYMFHHLPKCGGTSFNKFLAEVFNLTTDYHNPGGPKADKAEWQKYVQSPLRFSKFSEKDCIAGHYNLKEIYLWVRYPQLESLEHRKFSIIRDPFSAAVSGMYFNIKRGRTQEAQDRTELEDRVLARAYYFSRMLGISSEDEIDSVLNKYWFIAPLDRVDEAARMLEMATGNKGPNVGRHNTTKKPKDGLRDTLEADFRDKAKLDYAIYNRCVARFDAQVKVANT